MSASIQYWVNDSHRRAHRKDFYEEKNCFDQNPNNPCKHRTARQPLLGQLMLVVEELGEAASAIRVEDWNNLAEELADATIRIFDMCGAIGIDLETVIAKKAEINESRPMRHNKTC